MDINKYEEIYSSIDNAKAVEILQKIYTDLESKIVEYKEKIKNGEEKIFELYQPIIDKALALSNEFTISEGERKFYFLKAQDIATILVEKQEEINFKDEETLKKQENIKYIIIGGITIAVLAPCVSKAIKYIISIIKNA